MIVAELLAKFGFVVDEASAKKAQGQFDGLKKNVMRVASVLAAGAVVKSIIHMSKETAHLAENVAIASTKLGVSTDDLQKFQFAAKMSNVDVGIANRALQTLAIKMSKASKGTGSTAEAFKKMGVKVKNGDGSLRGVLDVALDVAGAMEHTSGATDRLTRTVAVFGPRAGGMVNVLTKGKDGLREMFNEAEALGAVFDKELIHRAEQYEDSQKRSTEATKGARGVIAKEVLPVLTELNDRYIAFIKSNREILKNDIAPIIGRIARAYANVSLFLGQVLLKFPSFFNALDETEKKLLAIGAAAVGLAAVFASPFLSLLALFGIIFLILDDIAAYNQGRDSVFGRLVKSWNGLMEIVNAPFSMEDSPLILYLKYVKRMIDLIADAYRVLTFDVLGKNLLDTDISKAKTGILGLAMESAKILAETSRPRAIAKLDAALATTESTDQFAARTMTINITNNISGAGDPDAVANKSVNLLRSSLQQLLPEFNH